jgi:dipeptidyl aminopeptidase/acylaminoacyl peptidase/tetratricopeptide (TPR) repeat protein
MQAVARSANWEAVVLFDRALETLGRVPKARRTLEHGIDLRIALEHALLLVGEPSRALEHLLEAEQAAEALGDRWRLGWVSNYLSEYYRTVSEHDRALAVGQRALDIGTALGDVTLQVETRLRIGQVYHARGDYRAAADLLAKNLIAPMAPSPYRKDESLLATISSQRAKTGLLSMLSRVWLVFCLAELGEFATGLSDGQVRLADSSSPRDPFQVMLACLAAGRLHVRKGDIDLAISFLEKCREAQRLGNFEVWSASISSTVGYAYLLGGRLDAAVSLLTEAIEQANATKSMFGHSLRLAYLGEAVFLLGRREEALQHARCALEVSRTQQERGHEAYVLRLLAEIAARQEPLDIEAATAAYRLALALTEELGMRPLMAQCHLGLGQLGRRVGHRELAERHLTAASALFRDMGMSHWVEKAEAAAPANCRSVPMVHEEGRPPKRAIVTEDFLRIRGVSDPQISPDADRVAFVVSQASEENDEYTSNIWVVHTAGGPPRRFTAGLRRDNGPRWSLDGMRLAFFSDRESKGKSQLYVMPSDGGEAVKITDLENGVAGAGPVWSPDGSRLAFIARVGGWREPKEDKERGKSRPARVITTAKYKFDGEGFIHDRPTQVFVVRADGGEPLQVTHSDVPAAWPVWSPDGQFIAFVSDRRPNWDEDWATATDLFIVPAAGGDLVRLTDTAGPIWQPLFSPDGRTIVYVGHRYPGDDGRNAHLFSIPFEGGKAVCLTESLDRPVWDLRRPVWSADGEWIVFVARDRATYPVYRVRAKDGGPAARIIGGERCITGLSVARLTGHIAFAATDPTCPAEVFVANPDGTAERPLTDLNREWNAAVLPSQPERFIYRRNDNDIDGWIMKPFDFDPRKRYPALLWIHGGPHREFGYYYSHEFQVDAGAGYVLIYTNPRGSQGYGEAFSRACVGDWGGGDFGDIMAGLDEALRRYPSSTPNTRCHRHATVAI